MEHTSARSLACALLDINNQRIWLVATDQKASTSIKLALALTLFGYHPMCSGLR